MKVLLALTLSLSLSYTYHLIIYSSNVLMKNGNVFYLLRRAHLYGFLIAFYCILVLLLLEEVIALLLNGPCSFQSTLSNETVTLIPNAAHPPPNPRAINYNKRTTCQTLTCCSLGGWLAAAASDRLPTPAFTF